MARKTQQCSLEICGPQEVTSIRWQIGEGFQRVIDQADKIFVFESQCG